MHPFLLTKKNLKIGGSIRPTICSEKSKLMWLKGFDHLKIVSFSILSTFLIFSFFSSFFVFFFGRRRDEVFSRRERDEGEDDFGDDEKYENRGVKPSHERGAIEGYSLEWFETLVENYAHVWVTRAFAKGEKQVDETTGRVNDRVV